MRCEHCREEISAQLDGEETAGQRDRVQQHLDSCPLCRRWADDAARVTRFARTTVVRPTPDVTGQVLTHIPRRRRPELQHILRAVLVVLGLSQLVLGLAQILDRADGHGVIHFDHESASWNIALGVGFVWIGWRASRAAGLVPTLTAFVGVLTVLSVADLIGGHVDLARLSTHSMIVLGYLVVLALARRTRMTGDGFPGRAAGERTDSAGDTADVERQAQSGQPFTDTGSTGRSRAA